MTQARGHLCGPPICGLRPLWAFLTPGAQRSCSTSYFVPLFPEGRRPGQAEPRGPSVHTGARLTAPQLSGARGLPGASQARAPPVLASLTDTEDQRVPAAHADSLVGTALTPCEPGCGRSHRCPPPAARRPRRASSRSRVSTGGAPESAALTPRCPATRCRGAPGKRKAPRFPRDSHKSTVRGRVPAASVREG